MSKNIPLYIIFKGLIISILSFIFLKKNFIKKLLWHMCQSFADYFQKSILWYNIIGITCHRFQKCQKYCENCQIYFIECRYCLTTIIIFGLTNQFQCKKCKRVMTIIFNITNV